MSDARELFGRGYQILQDRQRWEQKQRLYYQMRHDGLKRKNKPFTNAADLHLALIDEAIGKLKPFTLAQVLFGARLATFVSMRQQLAQVTESAAAFFDFEEKERSNLLRKLETVVDTMWLRGRGIIKSYVDPFHNYRLVHEAVDPLFILMPADANDFEDADEFVHVRHTTVAKFQRDRRYNQEAVDRVRGVRDPDKLQQKLERLRTDRDPHFAQIFADRELREGITHSRNPDLIVHWEHYVRTAGGWTVYDYSPLATETELRKPYGVPYKVGGEVSCPFFSFVAEVKDEGWYSPRGVAEKIAHHEIYGSKLWNEKADAITWFNRPLVTSDTPIANPANYRWQPGEYVPGNLKAVQMGAPAMSFDSEMWFVRGEAEQAAQMPDFGIQRQGGRPGQPRTATENERIATLQTVGTDHAGNIFRTDLCKLYKHDWGLMLQYKRASLTYHIAGDLKTLPEQALHDEYLIQPGGSTDEWDRAQKLQRASGRYQLFKGAPNVNQDQLVEDVVGADDARLVPKLLIPGNAKAASEAEDEATEILLLADGFPAQVKPGEDHVTRVQVLMGWLHKQGAQGRPVDPVARQRVQEHLGLHLQYLKELQPEAFRQVMAMIAQAERGAGAAGGPGAPGGAPAGDELRAGAARGPGGPGAAAAESDQLVTAGPGAPVEGEEAGGS